MVEHNNPWYRNKLFYLLAFLFLTPVWVLLILTDKKVITEIKMLSIAVLFIYLVYLPKLFLINEYPQGTYTVVYEVWCKDCDSVTGMDYLDASGNKVEVTGQTPLPWQVTFFGNVGNSLQIETSSQHAGDICCSITVNGEKRTYDISGTRAICFTRLEAP
jgi:hypothetical protein